MTALLSELPDVVISSDDWTTIMAYVSACDVEINGFAMVDYDERTNRFTISAPFILKQFATGASVETDDVALAMHMDQMMQAGKDLSRMRAQWHSHVNMQAYFSPTDTANMDRWAGDWLISIVANKRGEYDCRMDIYKPVRFSFKLKLSIIFSPPSEEEQDAVREQVTTLVHKPGFRRGGRPVGVSEHALASAGLTDLEDLLFETPGGSNGAS